MKKSVFADLAIIKTPKKMELEIFQEDHKILLEFWEFKQKEMGGTVPFAELFSRLVKIVWQDSAFSASKGQGSKKRQINTTSLS